MTTGSERQTSPRNADHPIEGMILGRWSPRAMAGEPVPESDLMRLFEAARWAPSSRNAQPWRFVYASRDSEHWAGFLDLLTEKNREWARNAAALVLIVSRSRFERDEKPAPTHQFDAGAAWENLALQGNAQGLVVHGMAGFDYDRAREIARVPEVFSVLAMAAIGVPGDPADLPQRLRDRERPSDRRPLAATVFEGAFPD